MFMLKQFLPSSQVTGQHNLTSSIYLYLVCKSIQHFNRLIASLKNGYVHILYEKSKKCAVWLVEVIYFNSFFGWTFRVGRWYWWRRFVFRFHSSLRVLIIMSILFTNINHLLGSHEEKDISHLCTMVWPCIFPWIRGKRKQESPEMRWEANKSKPFVASVLCWYGGGHSNVYLIPPPNRRNHHHNHQYQHHPLWPYNQSLISSKVPLTHLISSSTSTLPAFPLRFCLSRPRRSHTLPLPCLLLSCYTTETDLRLFLFLLEESVSKIIILLHFQKEIIQNWKWSGVFFQ